MKAVALLTTFYQSAVVRIGGGNTHRLLDKGNMMRKDFIPWTEQLPPSNVPLQIYCEVKNFIYPQAYTRQEIEAWSKVAEEIDAVNWSCVGWRLTGVAKEILSA